MRKIITTFFVSLSFLLTSFAYSEECDFGYNFGESFTEVTDVFGEIDSDHIEKIIEENLSQEIKHLSFKEIDFKILCPDMGLDLAKVRIYSLGNDQVGAIEVLSNSHISEMKDETQFISTYILKNYEDKIEIIKDPEWLGGISWEANNKKFYYNRILKFKKLIIEDLLITTNDFRKYF